MGEGSIVELPNQLHGHLKLNPADFHREVQPSSKLGVGFLWGLRDEFFYPFSSPVSAFLQGMPRPAGMACLQDFSDLDASTALMRRGRACLPLANESPDLLDNVAYHLEHERFVAWLEKHAAARGVSFTDNFVKQVETGGLFNFTRRTALPFPLRRICCLRK